MVVHHAWLYILYITHICEPLHSNKGFTKYNGSINMIMLLTTIVSVTLDIPAPILLAILVSMGILIITIVLMCGVICCVQHLKREDTTM